MSARRPWAASRVLAVTVLASSTACGGTATTPTTPTSSPDDVRRYFPLESSSVWSYEVDTGEATPTFATIRVTSVDAEGAHVQANREAPQVYVATSDAIRRRGEEGFVLHAPLVAGATFLGIGGREARIDATDATVRTGMGELTGCVRVVEVARALGNEITTLYCPDVGPASIVTALVLPSSGERVEVRATLIGLTRGSPAPDGTTVTH